MDFTKDYSNFTVTDFMSDPLFRKWVLEKDAKASSFWQYWMLENNDMSATVEEARMLLMKVQEEQVLLNDVEIENAVDKIFRQIEVRNLKKVEYDFFDLLRIHALKLSYTVILAIIALTVYRLSDDVTSSEILSNSKEPLPVENDIPFGFKFLSESIKADKKAMTILLKDGSKVRLEKGSQLIFPKNFSGETREIYLVGSAFFNVAKNPSKPFLVHSNGVVTKVIGTSFKIDAFSKNVKVMVKTGKVAVFTEGITNKEDVEKSAIVLTPNQEVTFKQEINRFEKSVQQTPIILTNELRFRNLKFEDMPVAQVFKSLNEAYGIDILFDEEMFRQCFITTSLTDESLFDKLTIICKTIGASYRQIDAKIIISGRGCR